MNKKWSIKEIIDLEYFFYADKNLPDIELDTRDRELYLENIKDSENTDSPEFLILKWISLRKKSEKDISDSILPGEMYSDIFKIIKLLSIIFGVLGGFSITAAFLSYTGKAPVNVSLYLLFFVFLQIIILITTLIGIFFRAFLKPVNIHGVVYPFVNKLIVKTIQVLKKNTFTRLSQDKKTGVEAAIGLINGKKKIYGNLFFWPVFNVLQIFGVFFNFGILTATLFKVTFSDLAFGWQTTLQVKAETIRLILEIISIPWSWVPNLNNLVPSIEEIEGSRMILKQGIYHLNTGDLAAWWPFLILSVLFYGFITRLIAWFCGVIFQKKTLNKIKFDTPECERLIGRMLTPKVSTSGLLQESIKEDIPESNDIKAIFEPDISFSHSYIALVPEEIKDHFNEYKLQAIVKRKLHADINDVLFVDGDSDEDMELILKITNLKEKSENLRLLIIMEAWQPPIKETLDYIKEITSVKGINKKVCIGLIGKPKPDTIFTKASDEHFSVWSKQILKTSNPNIYIERLEDQVEI